MMPVYKAFSRRFIILSMLLGLLLSGLFGAMLYQKELAIIEIDFKRDVDDKAMALERELLTNLEVLFAIKSLFNSSEEVTANEFENLASDFLARHHDIQALEWAPKVTGDKREEFEAARRVTYPDFEFTERASQGSMTKAGIRDVYFPVYFVEPLKGNEVAFGFDLASNESRLSMINRAIDRDLTLATKSITLVQEVFDQKGFLIVMPVYEGEPTTVSKRQEKLQGIVLGVYRIADIFESAVKHTGATGIRLLLKDNTGADAEELYANYSVDKVWESIQKSFSYSRSLKRIGGRQWTLIATPSQGYIAERQSLLPFFVCAFGSIFVLVGGGYIFLATEHSTMVREEAIERNRELDEAKLALEELSFTDGLTGIANRPCFDIRFEEEWLRALRDGTSLSLIMVDLDNFRLFNNTYGYIGGDQCLRDIANKLALTTNRTTDLVARYDADQFVILLPNTDEPVLLADKCRINIEKLHISHQASSVSDYMTISLGVASTIPTKHRSQADFMANVEELLDQAKELGKNRVGIARDILAANRGDILKFQYSQGRSTE
ncbi:CHASE domain-containing protein [Shewanella woodyi]|uniref:CHASE domain-containing protein n=1 Tax=Shewanella woodyi TaxID=60961 RepID=UPI003747BE79